MIPPKRVRYLSEIADSNRDYDKWVNDQSEIAKKLYALKTSMELLKKDSEAYNQIQLQYDSYRKKLSKENYNNLLDWNNLIEKYKKDIFEFDVRDKKIQIQTKFKRTSCQQPQL